MKECKGVEKDEQGEMMENDDDKNRVWCRVEERV